MPRSPYVRCCQITLALMLLAAPWVVYGAIQATSGAANTPLDWMPRTSQARVEYEQFRQQFESGDIAVIGWPGCTVDDPRLEQLAEKLEQATEAKDPTGQPWFERVLTGRGQLKQLTSEPLNLDRAAAIARLRGSLIGPDNQSSYCVVVFSNAGLHDRAQAVEFIQYTAEKKCGVPRDDQHLAGPVVDGLRVDQASEESLRRYAGLSGLAILLLGWWCLRSFRVAAVVFILAVYCALVSLALVYYCGETMNAVLIVMPPLVVVLGVSGGIHLVNYLYDALASGGANDLAHRAVSEGWLPCALSAGTTAIGVASLIVSDWIPFRFSDMLPIWQFGIYGAIGTSLTFVVLITVLPGAFEWSPWLSSSAVHAEHATHAAHVQTPQPMAPPHWSQHWAVLVIRYRTAIVIFSFILMGVTAFGLPRLKTSVRIETLFDKQSQILQDYRWLEKSVAPLVPIEVVLQFDRSDKPTTFERLELVRDVQAQLATLGGVGGTMSAATFVPEAKTGTGVSSVTQRTVLRRKLESHRDKLVDVRYLHQDNQHEAWRITARMSALDPLDYGHVLRDVQSLVDPVLAKHGAKDDLKATAIYTGIMPVVHNVQRELLRNLFSSFIGAVCVITVVMIVLERSLLAGLTAMVSNVFPIVVLFGALGWMDYQIDIGSVMTASVALGMAIDGTLHFLTFFHRGLHHGEDKVTAVESAFRHCAGAMIQSSVTCGLGIMVFVFSSFVPTSRFAWMIVLLIALALAGDLVILPALLTGPAGNFFKRRIAR